MDRHNTISTRLVGLASSPDGGRRVQRSIASLLAPLDRLAIGSSSLVPQPGATFRVGGQTCELPRYLFLGPKGDDDPIRIGLFAAIHGEEPEGAYALVRFLELLEPRPELAAGYCLLVYPVCNPTGCNPRSLLHAELSASVRSEYEELLWCKDAVVLEDRARSFPHRMRRHNENGLFIAERPRMHPVVEEVWYPKWDSSHAYKSVRRADGGWGSLVTFLPRDADTSSPRICDRLAVCKGPSLGAEFTLACPFTLLAHYGEPAWAESCGVSRYLIRLCVGLEDPQELWQQLDLALNEAGASPST